MELPQGFKEMLCELLGQPEALLLEKELDEPPLTAIRLNRRKPGAEFEGMSPVPWCRSGYYLDKRPQFIFDPLLHVGAYYVQDPSSMIYETLVEKILKNHFYEDKDNKGIKHLKVLDLCAAPGGKTTAIINALPDGSEVVANEYSRKRVGALQENIDRWGYPYVSVTNRDSYYFASQGENFDIIAVDAPCSGEGMMRKEEMARLQWSEELIDNCARLQRDILDNAVKALKPGGVLIYSTCTFNRRENECNAEYIVKELGLKPIDMQLPEEWGIAKGIDTDLPVMRFMPHKTKGEGLFVSVFKKESLEQTIGTSCPVENESPRFKHIKGFQKVDKQPESTDFFRVEVDRADAIKYLRGESLVLDPVTPKGMVNICYKGYELGPAKNIGSRANNLYPKNKRIRKQ
ncbi:MAG: hypothetical protein J1F38_05770 [Muribaculaceae bacterium]|nr:hypothetical protein [Muribaculaceae bacterium]